MRQSRKTASHEHRVFMQDRVSKNIQHTATMVTAFDIAALPPGTMPLVTQFLDVRTAGRLSCTNKFFAETLAMSPIWFTYAKQHQWCDDESQNNEDAMSITYDEEEEPMHDKGGLWKDVASFCVKARNTTPTCFYRTLDTFIKRVSGLHTKTNYHCHGTTTLEPDLYVTAASMSLSLPLEPAKLQALIDGNYCDQAPIGRGTETVMDLETRKGWRLFLGKDVLVGNPDFSKELSRSGFDVDSILCQVQENLMAHTMGKAEVYAQPYCMLIYQEGDFFKPHRDTLRGKNHFGSLIISLPVRGQCDGGQFVLTKSGHEDVVHYPTQQEEECKFYAFYTDVFHQVMPVTKGYRVTLTYHLWAVAKGPSDTIPRVPPSTAGDLDIIQIIFRVVMKKHLTKYNDCRYVFALVHKYGRSLWHSNLRGRDVVSNQVLQSLDGSGVDVRCETISFHRFATPTDPSEYKELRLNVVDDDAEQRDGRKASEQTIWLNQERLLTMDHEMHEYQYNTGNEGSATDFEYQHGCIVLQSTAFELDEGDF